VQRGVLGGIGSGLEGWVHADDLASGDENKKAFGSACGSKIIAHLSAIQVYLLNAGTDVCLPVDNEIDNTERQIRESVGHTADINRTIVISLCREHCQLGH